MATINDLLYNYQEGNEFVCSDGRMSVNGICQVEQSDSVDASKLTKNIIDTSKGEYAEERIKTKDQEEKVKREKILKDLEGESDYFPKLGKEKNKFEWDFDKDQKIDGYKSTISNNINAYNNWIETNIGIPSNVQTGMRVGGTAYALGTGASIGAAVAPWLLPIFAGGAINKAERERIQNITDRDKQGGNIHTVDMMTYDIPQPGDDGFNPHNDAGDAPDMRNTGPQNKSESDYGYGSDAGWY